MKTLTRSLLAALAVATLATTALAQAGAVVTPPRDIVAGTGLTLNPKANAAPANASTGAQTVNPAANTGAVTASPATGASTATASPSTGAVTATPSATTGASTATVTAPVTVTINPPPAPTTPQATFTCPPGHTCTVIDARNQVVVLSPEMGQQPAMRKKQRAHNDGNYGPPRRRSCGYSCKTTWNIHGNVNVYHRKHGWW